MAGVSVSTTAGRGISPCTKLMPAWLCREPDESNEYILLLGDRPAPVPLVGCTMKWGNSWNNEQLLTEHEWETLLGGVKLNPGDGPVKVGIRVEVWPAENVSKGACATCTGAPDAEYPHDECGACNKYPHQEVARR